MTALVAYNPPFQGSGRQARDAVTVISGALMQILFMRGEAPTSNGFAQPVETSSTRTAPALVIEPMGVSSAEAILELRRLSGLTWDELARLFDVSRRAVHHWASGSTMTAAHLHHVHQTLHLVRRLSQGASSLSRERILTPLPSGASCLDLLRAGDYAGVESVLGGTLAVPQVWKVSSSDVGAHPPLAAALSSLEDRPFRSVRSSRAAKTVRTPKAIEPR